MEPPDYVNELPPSSRLGSLVDYLIEAKLAAPIDMYNVRVTEILRAGNQTQLLESDLFGRLLVLGLVSAVEAYFRAVLSACIELCPIAQRRASNQTIHLGGLLWHGKLGFSRSAFEHLTFTSSRDLTSSCDKFIGMTLDDRVFKTLLEQFELVCHFRHSIVHGDGLLAGRNAISLDIPKFRDPVRIIIRYEQLQDIAAVLNTLVMTFNRHCFSEMCKRWAIDWRRRADWDPSRESETFAALWRLFHSAEERKRRAGRSGITKSNCFKAVKIMYNL